MNLSYQTLTFNRIAEDLVYQTIKNLLISNIGFESNNIHIMSPFPQYVNDRTQTTNNNQEPRFPSLAIYSTGEDDVSPIGSLSMGTQQSSYINATGTIYEPTITMSVDMEFCLEVLTKIDYRNYKNKMRVFFDSIKNGFTIQNDLLPESAGSVNLVVFKSREFVGDSPMSIIYPVKLYYKIYTEYIAHLFLNYAVTGTVGVGATIDNTDFSGDQYYNWWSGS